jgi:UDP-2,3-diacylglucosamine pyrophosphatase LpxH
MGKRRMKICVISDVHLGTYGCHAEELNRYLKSIDPEILILNGDIVDIWQFSKNYWPPAHMKIVNRILKMTSKGVKVYYITGNHDELLRRFVDFQMGNFVLTNKVILDVGGKKTWFFHGDVFDMSVRYSKWIAMLGSKGYDLLIIINRLINKVLEKMGREKVSISKRVKDSVKRAVKFVSDFEQTAMEMAAFHGFQQVVCGHIHQPADKMWEIDGQTIRYMNSGDWIENCTSLEYTDENGWVIYTYTPEESSSDEEEEDPDNTTTEAFIPLIEKIQSV